MPALDRMIARWHALPPTLRGILWAALAGVAFSLLNALMRAVTLELHPFLVAFWRYLFGTLALVPFILGAGLATLRVSSPGNHLLRSLIHTGGLGLWFFALPLIPIAETTALGFTTPLFAASSLLAKFVARSDSITAIVTWQSLLITLLCLPVAIMVWELPTPTQFLWLLLGGTLGTVGHLALSQSYKGSPTFPPSSPSASSP